MAKDEFKNAVQKMVTEQDTELPSQELSIAEPLEEPLPVVQPRSELIDGDWTKMSSKERAKVAKDYNRIIQQELGKWLKRDVTEVDISTFEIWGMDNVDRNGYAHAVSIGDEDMAAAMIDDAAMEFASLQPRE